MKRKIKLLLPKGSLNTPGRGDTGSLFKQAGYDIIGYEPGKENDRKLAIRNDPEIEVSLSRPQSAPLELILNMADAAIVGRDWVMEETNGVGVQQVADLEYGKTSLVFAVPERRTEKNLDEFMAAMPLNGIKCFTEYVRTTARKLASTETYKRRFGDIEPLQRLRGIISGDNEQVKVIMSDGVTEGYINKGADIILDNTQTGSTLVAYGLRILEEAGTSSAGLYASDEAMQDSWLAGKAREIATQLIGAVEARRKNYVSFNVTNDKLQDMIFYIERQGLFSEEPTVNQGSKYSQVSLLVPKSQWPEISRELVGYGARSIVRYAPEQVISGNCNEMEK
jgi:ATP phosphoribosyltransferase